MKLRGQEIKHYTQSLAEYLACVNGYSDFLIQKAQFEQAYNFNIGIIQTLASLAKHKKRKYRIGPFLYSAAFAGYKLALIGQDDCILATAKMMASEALEEAEKFKGTLRIEPIKELIEELKKTKLKESDINYVS